MPRVAARHAGLIAALVGASIVVLSGVAGTASNGAAVPLKRDATNLSVGLRVTPRTATRGKVVTYLMRVTNTGTGSARLLRVCDQIPLELTLVSAPPGFVRGGGRLVCRRFASLPANGTLVFKFQMRVSASARGGVVVNTAYARASGMVSFVYAQASLTIGVLGKCGSAC
jgi:uncharacterized repeat protein (TIGR01451 family)